MPVVSVILTSYNCGPYIGQAIRSILEQSYADFELLISDDCSTDNSREIITGLAEGDPRIRYFPQEKNLGLVHNYNFLFRQVRGEFVAIQDADDWSEPSRFEKQVEILRDPAFVLVGTGSTFHYPRSRTTSGTPQSHPVNGVYDDFESLPASVMFRAKLLRQFPEWPTYFAGGTSMDRYYLMNLLDGNLGFHIGEALYNARVRSGSSHRNWTPRKMTTHQLFLALQEQRRNSGTDWHKDGNHAAMATFEQNILKNGALKSESIREAGVNQVDCGNHRVAFGLLLRALLLQPSSQYNWRSLIYLAKSGLGIA
jgi:glycosyltransferase involved in cell wall biosynthesis